VGCVLYETDGHSVFFDPLAPAGDEEFWAWAEERCSGREVVLLETIRFHRRSRDEFAARYGASRQAPPTVVPRPLPIADETLYWLPEHRALVPGDILVGIDGELSLCPPAWLAYLEAKPAPAAVAAALRDALADLDVEIVLVSHGETTDTDGCAALARALNSA
jgi:hypothetical protein